MNAPLNRFPLFRTADEAAVEHGLVSAYQVRQFDLPQGHHGFAAAANLVRLSRVTLSFCQYKVPVRIHFPEAGYFRQQIVIAGGAAANVGARQNVIDHAHSFVTPAETSLELECSSEFEQLVLAVSKEALAKQLRTLGVKATSLIQLGGRVDMQHPPAQRMLRILRFVVDELESHTEIPQPILVELEDALINAFLLGSPPVLASVESQRASSIPPWQVKRAEEYIRENWHSPITIASLSRHVGASARSIFKSFRDARGCSPMVYVKTVRLNHARTLLERSSGTASVTQVAFACRFGNLGHFAKDYLEAFGELPSETLKRAKRK